MKLISNLLVSILYRKEQLKNQEENDKKLLILSKNCPNEVIEFFTLERTLNRILTYRYENLNPLNIYKITNENMEITKYELQTYNELVCDCQSLKEYIEEYKNRISKYQIHSDT